MSRNNALQNSESSLLADGLYWEQQGAKKWTLFRNAKVIKSSYGDQGNRELWSDFGIQDAAEVLSFQADDAEERVNFLFKDSFLPVSYALAMGLISRQEKWLLLQKLLDCLERFHDGGFALGFLHPGLLAWNGTEIVPLDLSFVQTLSNEVRNVYPASNIWFLRRCAPEKIRNFNVHVDQRVDFYSLGCFIYELFLGRNAFGETDPLRLVHLQLTEEPSINANDESLLPDVLCKVLPRLFKKNPEARPSFCHEIRALWSTVSHEKLVGGTPLACPNWEAVPKSFEPALSFCKRMLESGSPIKLCLQGLGPELQKFLTQRLQNKLINSGQQVVFVEVKELENRPPFHVWTNLVEALLHLTAAWPEEQRRAYKDEVIEKLQDALSIVPLLSKQLAEFLGLADFGKLGSEVNYRKVRYVAQTLLATLLSKLQKLALVMRWVGVPDLASLSVLSEVLPEHPTVSFVLSLDSAKYSNLASLAQGKNAAAHELIEQLKIFATMKTSCVFSTELQPQELLDYLQQVFGKASVFEPSLDALCELCLHRTAGVLEVLTPFLKNLVHAGALQLSHSQLRWQFDAARAATCVLGSDPSNQMAAVLLEMPLAVRKILVTAALLGSVAELQLVADSLQLDRVAIEAALLPYLGRGFFLSLDATDTKALGALVAKSVCFESLQCRNLALESLEPSERCALRLQILELGTLNDEARAWLLNAHIREKGVLSQNAQKSAARLLLTVGERSRAFGAFEAALSLLSQIPAIGSDGLLNQEEEFTLRMLLSECAYVCNNFSEHEHWYFKAKEIAVPLVRQIALEKIRLEALVANMQANAAVDHGVALARKLGVKIPVKPKLLHVIMGLLKTKKSLKKIGSAQDILQLGQIQNVEKREAMSLLNALMAPAFIARPMLFPMILYAIIELTLRNGVGPESSMGFAGIGVLLISALQDVDEGYRLGRIALDMESKIASESLSVRTRHIYFHYIHHWKHPLRETLDPLLRDVDLSLRAGDWTYASYDLFVHAYHAIYSGVPLKECQAILEAAMKRISDLKQGTILQGLHVYSQFVHSLTHANNELSGPYISQLEDYSKAALANNNQLAVAGALLTEAVLHLFHREAQWSLRQFANVKAYASQIGAHWMRGSGIFHESLAVFLSAQQGQNDAAKPRSLLQLFMRMGSVPLRWYQNGLVKKRLRKALELFKKWERHCPENHAYRVKALEGFLSALEGNLDSARERLVAATNLCERAQFPMDLALLHLAHSAVESRAGHVPEAAVQQSKCASVLEFWGASELAQRNIAPLEESFKIARVIAHKLSAKQAGSVDAAQAGAPNEQLQVMSNTGLRFDDALDSQTLLRLWESFATEIDVESLLRRSLAVVSENAAATRALVVCRDSSHRTLLAISNLKSFHLHFFEDAQWRIQLSNALCLSALDHVFQTGFSWGTDDAKSDPLTWNDPYLQRESVKSLLVLPLKNQGFVFGTLVLEHAQAVGAFIEKVNLIEGLAAQLSVALDHALLYRVLEEKVDERTFELNNALNHLKETQEELLRSEKLASVGRTVATFAHEMGTPLGVSSLSLSMLKESYENFLESLQGGALKKSDLDKFVKKVGTQIENLAPSLEQMAHLIDMFRRLSDPSRARVVQSTDLRQLFADVERSMRLRLKGSGVNLEFLPVAELQVEVIPGEFYQVLSNLILNAVNHAFEGITDVAPTVTVSAEKVVDKECQCLQLSVTDNGRGMESSLVEKIFEPFFTTRAGKGGTGLGLHVIQTIVSQNWKGQIQCQSVRGSGTRFLVVFPLEVSTARA